MNLRTEIAVDTTINVVTCFTGTYFATLFDAPVSAAVWGFVGGLTLAFGIVAYVQQPRRGRRA